MQRLPVSGAFLAALLTVAGTAVAQDGKTRIVEQPGGGVVVTLPDQTDVELAPDVIDRIESAIGSGPTMASSEPSLEASGAQRRDDRQAGAPGLVGPEAAAPAQETATDQPLDYGTSQPVPRQIVNLDQTLGRALTREGVSGGPAAGGDADTDATAGRSVGAALVDDAAVQASEGGAMSPTGGN